MSNKPQVKYVLVEVFFVIFILVAISAVFYTALEIGEDPSTQSERLEVESIESSDPHKVTVIDPDDSTILVEIPDKIVIDDETWLEMISETKHFTLFSDITLTTYTLHITHDDAVAYGILPQEAGL